MTADQQLKAIVEQFRTRQLTLEQETRLSMVARDLFISTDRAGMGVTFSMEVVEGGVGIDSATNMPGFFARDVLKSGDIIRSADGLPINTRSEARAAVLSHDPGDVMVLGILRRGTPMTVNLKLGNFSNLRDAQNPMRAEPPEPRVLDAAWKLRLNRELNRDQALQNKSSRPVIAGLLDEDRWANLERGLILIRQKMVQRANATGHQVPDRMVDAWSGPPRSIAAAGQPRHGKFYRLDGVDRGEDAAAFVGVDRQMILIQIEQIQQMINKRLIIIEGLSDQLNQPNLEPRARMALEAQITAEKGIVLRLESEIERFKRIIQPR